MDKKSFKSSPMRYIVSVFLLIVAVVFIIIGIKDGEISAVLSKATALCRECVGIG